MAVLAPVAIPLLFAMFLEHLRKVFVYQNGVSFALLVAALYVALFAFRSARATRRYTRHRRLIQGLCLACGYDLTANTSGTRPECGIPIPGDVSRGAGVNPRATFAARQAKTERSAI